MKVYLFRGNPTGSTVSSDSAAVKDALVTISDGNSFDTLHLTFERDTISKRKSYHYAGAQKNIDVAAGRSCFLHVRTTEGETIDAQCIIPPLPGLPVVTGTRENDDFNFTIDWDNPGKNRYFMLILDADGSYDQSYGNTTTHTDLLPQLIDDIAFPSDKGVLHNSYEGILPFAFQAKDPVLNVYVQNIDEALFNYLKSYQRYEQWNEDNQGGLFPNFQPLPQIYSNITGGAGIFAGYNRSSARIKP